MNRSRKPRIVLATDSRDPSGVGEHMLTLGRALSPTHDIVFAAAAEGRSGIFLERAAASGLAVRRLDFALPADLLLGGLHADMIHVHAGIAWEGHGLARAARTLKVPVIRTEHLPYLITDPDQHQAYLDGIDAVDHVISVSRSAAESLARAGVAHPSSSVIANGIAIANATVSREESRRALSVSDEDFVILTVARLTAQKGHADLFAAITMVPDDLCRRILLLLAGEGEERAALQASAIDLGIEDQIHFLGARDDISNLFGAADLFVLPSLFEGLPLALLEAMAAGVPTVATRIGGNIEALGEDHSWFAAANDPASLALTIEKAVADPAREQVATAARRRFEAGFSADRMARETASQYQRLMRPNISTIGLARTMQKTRIGFIGAGGIAQRHLGVLEQFEDISLVAFCDPDFARATDAAQRFGARAFETHSEMLDTVQLDAVYICIPPFAHGSPESDVIARQLPFFVEKPLSLDLDLAERLAREVARKGLTTAVGYHWRYLDTVEEATRLLGDNPAHLMSGYWLDQTPPPQWWWRQDRSGGQMVEQATHIIDLARVLAGEVVEVFGMSAHASRAEFDRLDVATASTASLRFASGAICNIGATCLLGWGHRIGLHVFADRLAIELSDSEIMVDVGAGRPTRRAVGDPVSREDRDFIDAVRGADDKIRCPYGDALETHRVALAIAESARIGKPVAIDFKQSEMAHG